MQNFEGVASPTARQRWKKGTACDVFRAAAMSIDLKPSRVSSTPEPAALGMRRGRPLGGCSRQPGRELAHGQWQTTPWNTFGGALEQAAPSDLAFWSTGPGRPRPQGCRARATGSGGTGPL